MLLNYVDRGSLATAAPLLQDELSLSGAQIGLLLSSFFWVYAPAQVLAGWLVHRSTSGGRSPRARLPPELARRRFALIRVVICLGERTFSG